LLRLGLEQSVGQHNGRDQPPARQPRKLDGQRVPAGDLAGHDKANPSAASDMGGSPGEHVVEILEGGV
jgi:hypothetical protein